MARKHSDIKLSEIVIIIPKEDDDEVEEKRENEIPMFDQTMSLLQMIKDKKVFYDSSKSNSIKTTFC